jgi:hypothetical protein
MNITLIDEGDVYAMEPETVREAEFLASCPPEWTWNRVNREWETNQDKESMRNVDLAEK